MSRETIAKYPDTGSFPEAQFIAQFMKPLIKPNDTINTLIPADYPLRFYFMHYGIDEQRWEPKSKSRKDFYVVQKSGNSIIDDKSIDSRAFNWNQEFNDVFQNGGFDIVIGNPPYIRHELFSGIKNYLQKNFSTFHGGADLYVYFIEKGISLLKKNGIFSIIVSNKFSKISYGKKIRNFFNNKKYNRFKKY